MRLQSENCFTPYISTAPYLFKAIELSYQKCLLFYRNSFIIFKCLFSPKQSPQWYIFEAKFKCSSIRSDKLFIFSFASDKSVAEWIIRLKYWGFSTYPKPKEWPLQYVSLLFCLCGVMNIITCFKWPDQLDTIIIN